MIKIHGRSPAEIARLWFVTKYFRYVCIPYKTLKNDSFFPRFKPLSFNTTYTSGRHFPFDIPLYKQSVGIGKSRGDPVLCPYLTPWCGGHFLMAVSVLTAGRPPGVNKGWTELETMPRPYAESLPLVKDRRVSARQVKSRRLNRRRACWYLNNKPSRGTNTRLKLSFDIWSSQVATFYISIILKTWN